MKQIVIFVEGPSDKAVLEIVFKKLIESKQSEMVFINVQDAGGGDRKKRLLEHWPPILADKIRYEQQFHAVLVPDLYPKNKGFPHETFEEMRDGILGRFRNRLKSKNEKNIDYLESRFKVFCFKHDLEVLLLAARNELLKYIGLSKIKTTWNEQVEHQNFDQPPKVIVSKLFNEANKEYQQTVDAIEILSQVDLDKLTSACPECFKPFVSYLREL